MHAECLYGVSHLQTTPQVIEGWESVAPTLIDINLASKPPKSGLHFHEPLKNTVSTCATGGTSGPVVDLSFYIERYMCIPQ